MSATHLAAAADAPAPRLSLFNGRTTQGWHATGCEAGVEEGLLVIQKGDGLLRTDQQYGDFILELDWRPRNNEKWDSGIYIRCDLPPRGKAFPARNQINLKQGDEGNLIKYPQARSTGFVKDGQWNHFKITARGDKVEMEINGHPAWSTTGFEPKQGYIGLQVEVPLGGQFEFKNLFVTELSHRPLFNGVDLTGWEGAGQEASKCWQVADGLLVCTGEKGPWLRTKEQFDDFNLRLEYKLREGGNSGVFVRVPASGNHHGKDAGIEIQLLDDAAARYAKLIPGQYSAGLYKFYAPQERVARPAGEWNSLEIDCQGRAYRIVHNGVTTVQTNADETAELKQRLVSGFLGLQNHSEEVWFRNVRIGPSQQ
jgi:hypothetical protein